MANVPSTPTRRSRAALRKAKTLPATDAAFDVTDKASTPPSRRRAKSFVLAPGSRIGPYEIKEELGRGGMGVVFRARDKRLGRDVALKTILGHADAESLERFLREARSAARLRHPGVVRVYEADVHDGVRCVALELVRGGSLAKRLKEKPPLETRARVEIARDLALAVAAAHDEGIIHRDLKPANVLLDEDGRPRLTDFGLARDATVTGMTATGDVLGTPSYMAPEQAAGGDVGPAADIYGLGAVIYELLVGRPPFTGRTPIEIVRKVIDKEPLAPSRARSAKRLPPIARDLETVCLKALEKDPSRRYASAKALADDLDRFLRHEPVLARPVGPLERAWRRARRSPAAIALGLVLAAGVVALLLWIQGELGRRSFQRELDAASERFRAGDLDGATEALARLEAPSGDFVAAVADGWAGLGVVRARRREEAAALSCAERALRVDPTCQGARMLRGGVLLQRGEAEAALADFDAVIATDGRNADALAQRAVVHNLRGESEPGLADADAALAIDGRCLCAVQARADALRALGRRDEELAAVERGLQISESAQLLARRALLRVERGEIDRAAKDARRSLELEPDSAVSQLAMGIVKCHERDFAGAYADLTHALGHGRLPLALRERAMALLWLHRPREALADLDACVQQLPRDPDAWTSRATVELELGDTTAASADLERALAIAPDSPRALAARGSILRRRGRLDEAMRSVQRAIEVSPRFPRGWSERGAIHAERGDFETARADLDRALELDPSDAEAWATRGAIRSETGDLEGAESDLDRSLALRSHHASLLSRGFIRATRGTDLRGAVADLTQAIDLGTADPMAWLTRALMHRKLGETKEAIADLEKYLAIAPRDHAHRAEAEGGLAKMKRELAAPKDDGDD